MELQPGYMIGEDGVARPVLFEVDMSVAPFWCCMCNERVQETDEPYRVWKPYVELTTDQIGGGAVFLCLECLWRIVNRVSGKTFTGTRREPAEDEEHWP